MSMSGTVWQRTVLCMMCGMEVRTKILANHFLNKHRITEGQVNRFCSIQLENHTPGVVVQQTLSHDVAKENKKTNKSEKLKLKKMFQDSLRDQYLNLDVFTKMLMDVSYEYHENRLGSTEEAEAAAQSHKETEIKENSEDKSDLKIRINLKEKRVMEKKSKKKVKETFHLHQCSVCNETFQTPAALTKHVKSEHGPPARRSRSRKNIKDTVKNHPIQMLGKNKRNKAS